MKPKLYLCTCGEGDDIQLGHCRECFVRRLQDANITPELFKVFLERMKRSAQKGAQ